MGKILSTILLGTLALLMTGCSKKESKDGKKSGQDAGQSFVTEESMEYVELKKVPLPCDKDLLYNAWKQIGVIELQRKKMLDYRANTPTLYISTDLDEDGNTDVLLRGVPPYAAIYTCIGDSVKLITCVEQSRQGLAITPEGIILRNGVAADGSTVSEFIRLENGEVTARGSVNETFTIENNTMVSAGKQYSLFVDSAMVKVSKDEYEKVAPQQNGTYLEDIDGWEDFRTP